MGKQFNSDREKIVEQSLTNGTGLIITGTDLYSSEKAIEFIRKHNYKNVWCTVGCHPHNAKELDDSYLADLHKLIRDNKDIVVAVGECGLDYDRMFSTADLQLDAFKGLIKKAEKFNLPLFLHERSAEDAFVKIMKGHRPLCRNSVVHCFTGDKNTVYRYLQMGFMIGITGWICDNRRNKDLIEALKIIPLERLLVETDAPYLTPLGLNLDKRNIPNNIIYVIDKIAQIKGVSYEEIEKHTLENTKKLFNID